MRFLDTNVFVRALVADDDGKARSSAEFFRAIERGEEAVTTSELVVAEIAYVLRSKAHYGMAPAEIGTCLRPILALRGLKLQHKGTFIRALELWEAYPALDFEDVLSVAHMERLGVTDIVSYDTDFDGIGGVRRSEPTPV